MLSTPVDCKEGSVCPVFKKNYSIINLGEYSAKCDTQTASNIIFKSLKIFMRIPRRYSSKQNYHSPKSVIRQTIEKFCDCNADFHTLFLDFREAFDSKSRNYLFIDYHFFIGCHSTLRNTAEEHRSHLLVHSFRIL
jgi:hypothetical protein